MFYLFGNEKSKTRLYSVYKYREDFSGVSEYPSPKKTLIIAFAKFIFTRANFQLWLATWSLILFERTNLPIFRDFKLHSRETMAKLISLLAMRLKCIHPWICAQWQCMKDKDSVTFLGIFVFAKLTRAYTNDWEFLELTTVNIESLRCRYWRVWKSSQ